jgi:hypothetical protein
VVGKWFHKVVVHLLLSSMAQAKGIYWTRCRRVVYVKTIWNAEKIHSMWNCLQVKKSFSLPIV